LLRIDANQKAIRRSGSVIPASYDLNSGIAVRNVMKNSARAIFSSE
jgi:hypothetical protein